MANTNTVKESAVQAYTIRKITDHGHLTRKLAWRGRRDALDDFVAISGVVWLLEFKRPGEKPRHTQALEHEELRKHGVNVAVIDSFECANEWLRLAGIPV